MCHWSLLCGARRAVAVEAQPDFCTRARGMLERAAGTWPAPEAGRAAGAGAQGGGGAEEEQERFDVVQMGVREFLAGCAANSFDVVIAAGLLHCFVDPVNIVLEMSRVARVALVLEVDQPEVYVSGALSDGDHDSRLAAGHRLARTSLARGAAPAPQSTEHASLLQLAPSALVNRSGDDSSFTGVAVVPSRALLEGLVGALGFEPTRVRMRTHPTRDEDVRTYSGCRRFQAVPKRFFLRCVKPAALLEAAEAAEAAGAAIPRSLEDAVVSGQGDIQRWQQQPQWWKFRGTDKTVAAATAANAANAEADAAALATAPTESAAAAAVVAAAAAAAARAHTPSQHDASLPDSATAATVGAWSFDREVADRFAREARCHIPDYISVVEASIDAVERTLAPSSVTGVLDREKCDRAKQAYGVIDVGSATGHTMLALRKRGFGRVFGVDASSAMLEGSRANLRSAGHAAEADGQLALGADFPPRPFFGGTPLGAVIANWTLHFIVEPAARARYLRSIHEALAPGGCLVLTEKTRQDAAARAMYHAWKQAPPRNVSDREVEAKSKRLIGVLETLPVQW
jgi:SAM-dependent methyltransferase